MPLPSYLTWDAQAHRWVGKFAYPCEAHGATHWPRKQSPYTAKADRNRAALWAHDWRRQWIEAHDAAIAAGPTPTLGQVITRYEADARARGVRWARDGGSRAGVILATLGKDTPVSELTPAKVAAWRARIREDRVRPSGRPLANRSLNAYTTLLQAALNFAASPEVAMIQANPLARLRRLPETLRVPPALSEVQIAAVLRALDVWEAWAAGLRCRPECRPRIPLRTRVLLGYWTAGRPEALGSLRWADVDLERGRLVYSSKGHRNIVVPLEPMLLAHMRRLRARMAPAPSNLLMPSTDTGRPVVRWRTQWERLLAFANAGLPEEERIPPGRPIHALRHSRITHLLLGGMSPQAVAQLAGTSVAMLHRHYAHLMISSLEAELARVNRHPALRRVAAALAPKPKPRAEAPQSSMRHVPAHATK